MKYITKREVALPRRNKESKKGDNGKVLIVAGSENYPGAAALAGIAALRSGVDWVTIACPEKVAWAINALLPDLVTIKLKGNILTKKHVKTIITESKKHNCILIGSGLGLKNQTIGAVKEIVKSNEMPKVIDADGIKALTLQEVTNAILTPHAKELEILLQNSFVSNKAITKIKNEKNQEKKASLIKRTIQELSIPHENGKTFFENNNSIVLKGKIDAIIAKNKIYYNKTGNAGMTKAGTGDVLAGLTAGFLAQSKNVEQSAVNAAYYNGLIGDILLKKKKGFTYLASDMAEEMRRLF